jgi:hypothetical protein
MKSVWRLVAIQASALVLMSCGGQTASPPSPSPTVAQVTLAELEAKPLHLPVVQPGAQCPAGPSTTIHPRISVGQSSSWDLVPVLGAGPVYGHGGHTTATAWGTYFDVTAFTDPNLTGLVLVRGHDLESDRPLVFVGPHAAGNVVGTDTIDGQPAGQHLELVFDAGHHDAATSGTSKWGIWPIRDGLAKGESGCTGFQLDGAGFSEVFVSVHAPAG